MSMQVYSVFFIVEFARYSCGPVKVPSDPVANGVYVRSAGFRFIYFCYSFFPVPFVRENVIACQYPSGFPFMDNLIIDHALLFSAFGREEFDFYCSHFLLIW